MTKIKITGLEEEARLTRLKIGNAIKRSNFQDELADLTVEKIRKANLVAGISSEWSERRDKLATVNAVHPDYKLFKSNLTFTGQLLNSVVVKFVIKKLTFIYTAKGSHKPYVTRTTKSKTKKKSKGKSVKNSIILNAQNKDRPVLQVFVDTAFRSSVEKALVIAIRRFFK